MFPVFAVSMGMGPVAWSAAVFSAVGFLVMFGIASAKGDFLGMAKSTLQNDKARRIEKKSK